MPTHVGGRIGVLDDVGGVPEQDIGANQRRYRLQHPGMGGELQRRQKDRVHLCLKVKIAECGLGAFQSLTVGRRCRRIQDAHGRQKSVACEALSLRIRTAESSLFHGVQCTVPEPSMVVPE